MNIKWISVKENLPRDGQKVLASDGDDIVICTYNAVLAYWDADGVSGFECELGFKPTYWSPCTMQLPPQNTKKIKANPFRYWFIGPDGAEYGPFATIEESEKAAESILERKA